MREPALLASCKTLAIARSSKFIPYALHTWQIRVPQRAGDVLYTCRQRSSKK